MEQIKHNLCIGSWKDAERIKNNKAARLSYKIITVAKDASVQGDFFYPISDPGDEPDDTALMQAAIDKIDELIRRHPILVHCVSGVNRSAGAVIGHLYRQSKDLAQSFNLVAARRRINPLDQILSIATGLEDIDRTNFLEYDLSIEETIVNNAYNRILRRDADPDGLKTYSNFLYNGQGSIEDLEKILMNSDEFKRRMSANEN